jgi:hypothetical protein
LKIIGVVHGQTHAEIYRLRCARRRLAEIGEVIGVNEQTVVNRLMRIRAVPAARGDV